tara:strand:- start:2677 stop:2784 length:108 start_codon:yes stop_codon:yes gene_type:complete
MNNINEVFGKQLRSLDTDDFEKRTFKLGRYIKNGI